MSPVKTIAIISIALLITACASTPEPIDTSMVSEKDAVEITFANHGGIKNWKALDNKTLLIEGRNDQWYRASFFAPCFGLNTALSIGFKSNPAGNFDDKSAIIFDRQYCRVSTLEKWISPENPAEDDESEDT